MNRLEKFLLLLSLVFALPSYGQLTDGLEYKVELQNTAGSGDNNPLWLNANKYGLSSIDTKNGYVRGALIRPLRVDSARRWGIGYGVDMAVPYHFTSHFVVQQAYVEARWLKGALTVGSKEVPMELKNQELSSGSQCLGINARPVPQIRLSLPEYWNIPGLKGMLALKGHIAYGMMTDGAWQQSFNTDGSKYQKNVLYHSKAGYLRIGNEQKHPLEATLGLEMATTFGGEVYRKGQKYSYKASFSDFVDALIPFDQKDDNSLYTAEGNMVGSLLISVSYKFKTWKLRAYTDHYFDDGSQMYFLDYDSYGSGANWDKKEGNRYLLYDLKDGMYGLEVTLPKNRFVSTIVGEYLYTKYQSGSIYYDHSSEISDHIGGRDDYYNHYEYVGWQHWGQVIGNPLYLSPVYNKDGSLYIKNNRFVAWHFGISGEPLERLHYRVLMTWQKGWGTYNLPYADVQKSYSLLAEASYMMPERIGKVYTGGWSVKAAIGLDDGEIRGNNTGVQITIVKTGLLKGGKK